MTIDIASLRKRLGLSQQAFAEKLFTNQSTVSRWERGTSLPRGAARYALERLDEEARALPASPAEERAA